MTLPELLVSMMVLGIALTAILGVLASVQRGVEDEIDYQQRVTTARQATYAIDREVRSASAMDTADGGRTLNITTRTNSDTRLGTDGEMCAQFHVSSDGELLHRWWPTNWVAGTVYPWKRITEGLAVQSAFAIDGSFDSTGNDNYGGQILNVNFLVDQDGGQVAVQQVLRGDNITDTSDNLCDEAGEQPATT